MSEHTDLAWFVAVALLLSAAHDTVRLIREHRAIRRLAGARTVPVAAAEPGELVAVNGTVAAGPGGDLTGPLSGRKCVWWAVQVDVMVNSTENRSRWHCEIDRHAGLFALHDASGTVLVDGRHARSIAGVTLEWSGWMEIEDLVQRLQVKGLHDGRIPLGRHRFEERALPAGAGVTAVGHVHHDDGQRVLRLTKDAFAPSPGLTLAERLAAAAAVHRRHLARAVALAAAGTAVLVAAVQLGPPPFL